MTALKRELASGCPTGKKIWSRLTVQSSISWANYNRHKTEAREMQEKNPNDANSRDIKRVRAGGERQLREHSVERGE